MKFVAPTKRELLQTGEKNPKPFICIDVENGLGSFPIDVFLSSFQESEAIAEALNKLSLEDKRILAKKLNF